MKLVIEKGVKEYLEKHNAECVVIDMIKDHTSGGCCCGATKPYYTPYVRVGLKKDNLSKKYVEYETDGLHVFIAEKAMMQIQSDEHEVNIYLEKTLLNKKLNVNGIKTIVDE